MLLEIQIEIIKFPHCSYLSGHFQIHKTDNTFLKRFWWSKLLSDVKEYINSCLLCNRMKHPRRKEGYMAIDPWYKAWHNLQNYQHKLYCSTEKNKHSEDIIIS